MTDAEKIAALEAELAEEKKKTSMLMGVGDGSGQLFVYGNYDSIKAAQSIVLDRDRLTRELAEARENIHTCAMCQKPAACWGYESENGWLFMCSECCGHGDEGGECWLLDDIPTRFVEQRKQLTDLRAQLAEKDERIKELEGMERYLTKTRGKAQSDTVQLQAELAAARQECERLKAGGCARDQRTTQFCAEAVALTARLAEARKAQDIARMHISKIECIGDMAHAKAALAALSGAGKPADSTCAGCAELKSILKELVDLVEDSMTGEYKFDSFSLQPARNALAGGKGGVRCWKL